MAVNPIPMDAPERLSSGDRRAALLDVAKAMVEESGPDSVTIGTVAERAGVTRALVYKHFDNKGALLLELYQREARALDRRLRLQVEAAEDGFEKKLRAFVGACLDAVAEHGPFFSPLRTFGDVPSTRQQQRGWDRRTSRYFATLAAEEYGIDERTAISAIGVLFSGLRPLLSEMRHDPSRRDALQELYVEMTLGAFARLATARPR